jgi:thioredoxin-dependent peroxiredoxin
VSARESRDILSDERTSRAIRETREMIEIGQPAPDFTLPDQHGDEVTLSKLRGAPVVLYFYPRDNTPGCTTEACDFRDARRDYEKAGARVIGVSPDTVASHRKFVDKFELPFTLVADVDHKVCEAYGVWKEKNLYGKKSMGVERSTFVIDREGLVRRIFPKVKVAGHSDAVLEALRSLS